ncbi:hypothetical protein EUGRSUZ_G01309 [Eucalyptus grandis]|uniref:Uncharacterized protein n=2 Tax=Eucalyptus grandis TaxID=71139 RepID=A0ACC3K2E5_EUCGR|nr:hypothetical protein EUGRSUZ_G01309 [Eucalyptus grandis]
MHKPSLYGVSVVISWNPAHLVSQHHLLVATFTPSIISLSLSLSLSLSHVGPRWLAWMPISSSGHLFANL